MNKPIDLPPALTGTFEARLGQLYRYLYRMAEQLNVVLDAGSGSQAAAVSVTDDTRELRTLLLNTAAGLRSELDTVERSLRGMCEEIGGELALHLAEEGPTVTEEAVHGETEGCGCGEYFTAEDGTVTLGTFHSGLTVDDTELRFTAGGSETARLRDRCLYTEEINAENRLTLGDWLLEAADGLTVRYLA